MRTPKAAAFAAPQTASGDARMAPLKPDQVAFLEALADSPELQHWDDFTPDERLFLIGVRKRMESQDLDLPMLPEASLRLSEMLRRGDRPVATYVELIGRDAALAIEVLQAANSALLGSRRRTTSLTDAVVRLGLVRVQSLLMLKLMKTRVIKCGPLQGIGELLIELSQPIADLASLIAPLRRLSAESCYVKGMLLHVEYPVILGLVPVIGRDHRKTLEVSAHALNQAFVRFGPGIRTLLTSQWIIDDLLALEDEERALYTDIREAIIRRWLRQPLPSVDGCPAERLEALLSEIPPRVDQVRTADESVSQVVRTRSTARSEIRPAGS